MAVISPRPTTQAAETIPMGRLIHDVARPIIDDIVMRGLSPVARANLAESLSLSLSLRRAMTGDRHLRQVQSCPDRRGGRREPDRDLLQATA